MTLLRAFTEDGKALAATTDADDIRRRLGELGIGFDRWPADADLPPDAAPDDVVGAYRREVDRVMADGGYRLVDVVRLRPDDTDPEWPATAARSRAAFRKEHVHDEDEVRFFVEGSGCFYLHLGDEVHAVVCEAGDLLSVPAGTAHWFDMGSVPRFCAIRFFTEEDGWVADFTGDPIAERIPDLDELMAGV
jgi:1,2-dihydroxy-3-keto-5-methylthiopentene dioxygenase